MVKDLNIRLLKPSDFPQMYRTFMDAFSRYAVSMELSKEAFRERMEEKVNISYKHSVGGFHGEKLIGFIFNSINQYEGRKTAYNGGTGVLMEYWGQGLTKKMYEFVLPILKNHKIERCLLEVVTTNKKAIRAYEKTGFSKTKYFKCFMLKRSIPNRDMHPQLIIKRTYPKSISKFDKLNTSQPSMLDSSNQLIYNLKNETCLEATIANNTVGYLFFQHKTGRISQLGIKKEVRRQGIATALLTTAHGISENKSLTILNIEENDNEMIHFLLSNGFVNEIDQLEMEMKL